MFQTIFFSGSINLDPLAVSAKGEYDSCFSWSFFFGLVQTKADEAIESQRAKIRKGQRERRNLRLKAKQPTRSLLDVKNSWFTLDCFAISFHVVCIDVAFHVASYFSCRQFNRMQKAFAIPRACLHFANLREIGLGVFLALLVLGIRFWFNIGMLELWMGYIPRHQNKVFVNSW